MSIKKILVALRLEYSSNRKFLTGIAKFIRRQPSWQVTIAENFFDFSREQFESLSDNTFDGLITVPPRNPEILKALSGLTTPMAFIGSLSNNAILGRPNALLVQGDNLQHGAKVARHFQSLGTFRSYAFVETGVVVDWGGKRREGFVRELQKQGIVSCVIRSPYADGSPEDVACLSEQLARLPKPAAVMAAYDQRAVHVLQACSISALSVPGIVQVIGVDNDPILCDFSRPALTSLAISQSRIGEVAAMELNYLIQNGTRRTDRIILKDAEIVERDSTAPLSPSSHLVARALTFIRENLTSEIKPRDVVANLKVSRALADRRFRELEGMSIGEAITRQRLSLVRQKLRRSSHPIIGIVRSCGFSNPDHANRLFKRAYGMTMRDYRKGFTSSK